VQPTASKRILLIDEVDVFLSSDFYGQKFPPKTAIQHEHVNTLQDFIWDEGIKGINGRIPEKEIEFKGTDFACLDKGFENQVHGTQAYQELQNNVIHTDFKWLVEHGVRIMIHDLREFLVKGKPESKDTNFHEFKVITDEGVEAVLKYKVGDSFTDKVSYGYKTLWAYYNAIRTAEGNTWHSRNAAKTVMGRLLEKSRENKRGIQVKCGTFSYAQMPYKYEVILGVTGTLMKPQHVVDGKVEDYGEAREPLGEFERSVLQEVYKINGMTDVPSVYGYGQCLFKPGEENYMFIAEDEDAYYLKILQTLEECRNRKFSDGRTGRPVVVYFASEEAMDKWIDWLPKTSKLKDDHKGDQGTRHFLKGVHTHLTESELKGAISTAAEPSYITLFPRDLGRGTDFQVHDADVDIQMDGLLVVQTFLSDEMSEEIQIRGRTARQKKKGAFKLILLAQDLAKVLQIESASEGGAGEDSDSLVSSDWKAELMTMFGNTPAKVYGHLHDKREKWLIASGEGRKNTVAAAEQFHNATTVFQDALSTVFYNQGTTPTNKTIQDFLYDLNSMEVKIPDCRLLICFDATASMNEVRDTLNKFMKEMMTSINEHAGKGQVWVKLMAYRDYDAPPDLVVQSSEWTDNTLELMDFLKDDNTPCSHGFDIPEAIEAALEQANNPPGGDHKPTGIVLIGDAPAHASSNYGSPKQNISENEGKGKKLIAPLTGSGWSGKVNTETLKSEKVPTVKPASDSKTPVLTTDWKEQCKALSNNVPPIGLFPVVVSSERNRRSYSGMPAGWLQHVKDSFTEIANAVAEPANGKKIQVLDVANKDKTLVQTLVVAALSGLEGGEAFVETFREKIKAGGEEFCFEM
jgi:hypothetical protein